MATKTTRHNGAAIRTFRIRAGLTVQEVCNKVTSSGKPLSAPALRNIENEHREGSAVLIQKIADAMDVPVQAIIRVPLTDWPHATVGEKEPAA